MERHRLQSKQIGRRKFLPARIRRAEACRPL
jgi:hypothetical protein